MSLKIVALIIYLFSFALIFRNNYFRSTVLGRLTISDAGITIGRGQEKFELPIEKVKKIDLEYLGLGDRWVSSIWKIRNRLKITTEENETIEHVIIIKNKKEKEDLKRILREFKENKIDLRIHNLNPNLAVNF